MSSPDIVHNPDNMIMYLGVWALSGELKGLIDDDLQEDYNFDGNAEVLDDDDDEI